MKKIEITWEKGWESKQILTTVAQVAQDGIRYDEIKRRMRILDVLEAIEESDSCFYLEDADWEHLKSCINSFKFGAAHKSLVGIIEAVMGAEDGSPSQSVPAESVPDRRVPSSAVLSAGSKSKNGKLGRESFETQYLDEGAAEGEYVER